MILGISFDTVESNRAFAQKFGYPYRLLCDPDRSTGEAYGVIDPEDPPHPLRISFLIGPDRRIVKVYEVKDFGAHAGEVLADLP